MKRSVKVLPYRQLKKSALWVAVERQTASGRLFEARAAATGNAQLQS